MYKFRKERIPDFLIGKELFQVCFGASDLILNFSDTCKVIILSIDTFIKENEKFNSNGFINIIGQSVRKVIYDNETSITIAFDDFSIKLSDDSEFYESVIFRSDSDEIVV